MAATGSGLEFTLRSPRQQDTVNIAKAWNFAQQLYEQGEQPDEMVKVGLLVAALAAVASNKPSLERLRRNVNAELESHYEVAVKLHTAIRTKLRGDLPVYQHFEQAARERSNG